MAHIRRVLEKTFALGMIAVRFCSYVHNSTLRLSNHARRHFLKPSPILSAVLSLALLVQTCTLPIPVAFLLISADAAAVTEKCETKSCCTPLCYVDKEGNHHCVHKHGDSGERPGSTDDSDGCPVLIMTLALAPETGHLLPSLEPIGLITAKHDLQATRYPSMPTPPPK